jgi:membrane peptidoglycan carboxypeptidase
MRKMLTMVVTSGTATTAQLNGYTSAGKTGTAQKIDPRTRTYSKHDFVASFVGFAPVEAPQFTILVVVDSPRGKIYGGDVAAPVFKRIAEQILAYRNVSPSLPTKPALLRAAYQPSAPRPITELQQDLNDSQLQNEGGDANFDANSAAMLSLEQSTAPAFVGKSVRAVAERAQVEGVAVKLIGSGIAYQQSPPPGSTLAEGQRVSVWFRVGGTAGLVPAEATGLRQPNLPARPPVTSQPSANRIAPQQTKWLEPAAGAPKPAPGNTPARPVQSVPFASTG